MLSTIDNPFNPKEEYAKWQTWDRENGYDTESFVARLIQMDEEYDVEDDLKLNDIESRVIQDILEHDVLGVYILV